MTWLLLTILAWLWSVLAWGQVPMFPGPGGRTRAAGGGMAHVQTVNNSVGSGSAITVTLTTTAGHLIVVNIFSYYNATTFTQSGAGDTLTQAFTNSGNGLSRQYYNCNSAGGSRTFTMTITGGTTDVIGMFVSEFSGNVTSSCFDVSAQGTYVGSGTSFASGTTATTTTTNAVGVAFFQTGGTGPGANLTAASNSYVIPTGGNTVSTGYGGVAYKVLTATGTQTTTFTTDISIPGIAMIGTYKGT